MLKIFRAIFNLSTHDRTIFHKLRECNGLTDDKQEKAWRVYRFSFLQLMRYTIKVHPSHSITCS